MSELREAKAKLRELLKDESGIAGFGVGDGTLRVYISKESARVLVPKNYEGIPVEVLFVGPITTQEKS